MTDETLDNLLGPGFNLQNFERQMVRQSQVFYVELLPILYQCALALRKPVQSVCDIGANSGAGAALLSDVLNHLTGIRVAMKCFDADPRYQRYAQAKFPQISYETTDFTNHPEPFDIAICSHTLEHIPKPEAFVQKVLDKVTGAAIFFTPYEEKDLHPAHVNVFDERSVAALPGVIWAQVFKSVAWRTEDGSQVVAFVCAPEARLRDGPLIEALRERLDGEMRRTFLNVWSPRV